MLSINSRFTGKATEPNNRSLYIIVLSQPVDISRTDFNEADQFTQDESHPPLTAYSPIDASNGDSAPVALSFVLVYCAFPYHLTTLPPYHLTTLPPYCLTTLLPYCLTALLPYCLTALLPYCHYYLFI